MSYSKILEIYDCLNTCNSSNVEMINVTVEIKTILRENRAKH